MTLQIEEGKFYRTRDGRKVGPIQTYCSSDSDFPHRAPLMDGVFGIVTWSEDGLFGYTEGHPSDLVAEWIDEPEQSGFTQDELTCMSDAVIEHMRANAAPAVTKRSVLETAIQTVADRGVPYGGVEDNFNRIARLWTSHLFNRFDVNEGGMVEIAALDPSDVAMMMALMKIARLEANPGHADSWVDVAGYAACGGEIGAKLTVDKPS